MCNGDSQSATGNNFNLMAKIRIKMRRDDKTGNANGEHGQKTAGDNPPIVRACAAVKNPTGKPTPMAKQNASAPSVMETGSPCAMMSLTVWLRYLSDGAEIPVRQIAEVAQVLFPNRFVQMIFGLHVAFDFRRRGLAFAVKRAAGREMHQHRTPAR